MSPIFIRSVLESLRRGKRRMSHARWFTSRYPTRAISSVADPPCLNGTVPSEPMCELSTAVDNSLPVVDNSLPLSTTSGYTSMLV